MVVMITANIYLVFTKCQLLSKLLHVLPDFICPQSSGADTAIIPICHWRKLGTERFGTLLKVS